MANVIFNGGANHVICNSKNMNFFKIDNGSGNTTSVVGATNSQSTSQNQNQSQNQHSNQNAGQYYQRNQGQNQNFQGMPFNQNTNWSFQPNQNSHISSSTSNYSIRINNNMGGIFIFNF